MIEHYVFLCLQKGNFCLGGPACEGSMNLGDYLEGRFLGNHIRIAQPNGILYFYAFEILFSAIHNETNTLVTWFYTPAAFIVDNLMPFILSKKTITLVPNCMETQGLEWYCPRVKELI